MRPTLRARLIRLVGAGALAGVPAAAGRRSSRRRPTRWSCGSGRPRTSTRRIRTRPPSCPGYEAFQLTYNLLVDFGDDVEPVPGFADSWERAADRGHVPHPDRDEVVGRRAGDLGRRVLQLAARRSTRIDDDSQHRPRLPRPEPQGCRRHQGRVPRRPDHDRLHDRPVRPDLPGLPADHAQAHLGQVRLQDHRRRRSSTPPLVGTGPYTLAEWKTGQFMRFVRNPNYWGNAGLRRRGRHPDLQQLGHDGPGAQVRRPRLRPRRQRRPVQGAQRPSRTSRPSSDRPTAGRSSRSTTTAPAPARRSRAAARRPRPSSIRRSATRSATPSTSRRSSIASSAASATWATTIVPPVLAPVARRADHPRTFDIDAGQAEARRRRLQARRRAATGSTRRASRSPSGCTCPTRARPTRRRPSSSRTGTGSSASRSRPRSSTAPR